VRLHRAPAAPATPAYEPEPGRVLRLAQEGLYWQGEVEDYATHAMVLHCALDLLAVNWRSERLREEQSRLGGVGAQGERLAALTARLKRLADGV